MEPNNTEFLQIALEIQFLARRLELYGLEQEAGYIWGAVNLMRDKYDRVKNNTVAG